VVRAPAIGAANLVDARLEPAPVTGDAEQLYQVALNLVSNAIGASAPGATVRVTTRVEGDAAVLEVADDGRGIAAEDLPKVWTPFFSRRPGGTGLGLPIVRRIVEAHGGTIELESRPAHGTTATVRLPLRSERDAP
jgi:signal transduction histidine kinase